jgi:hypothetical protein
MSAGKGDKPRPVDKKEYDKNYDQIRWVTEKNKLTQFKNKKGKSIYVYR